ncbi:hypothetical protein Tco_1092045 [Tanacetum coccineum]|uniref:Uncharacterized protein n=1 Tax=Tanacetum coccineum TaxID=301880 RepID=A0ABQ5I8R0_9ASTR
MAAAVVAGDGEDGDVVSREGGVVVRWLRWWPEPGWRRRRWPKNMESGRSALMSMGRVFKTSLQRQRSKNNPGNRPSVSNSFDEYTVIVIKMKAAVVAADGGDGGVVSRGGGVVGVVVETWLEAASVAGKYGEWEKCG